MLTIHKKIMLALGLLVLANVAVATPITLTGDHYAVTYDDALVGLYGSGSVSGSGDTVFFTPTRFKVLTGSGSASVSSAVALTFTIDPGYVFSGLSYSEGGDYSLLDAAAVNVVTNVMAKNAATLASASFVLAPGAPLDSVTSFDDFETTDWSLAGNLSLSGLGAPTTLLVTLDNELFASASPGGEGFIEKKFVGLKILTASTSNAVPEPASWTLLLVGMLAAQWIRSRRRGREPRPLLANSAMKAYRFHT